VVGTLIFLSMNNRGSLEYPAASSLKEDGITVVPNLVEHISMTFGSAKGGGEGVSS
jgi:hypothetical protein